MMMMSQRLRSSSPSTPRRRGGISKRKLRPSLKPPNRLSWPASLSSQEDDNSIGTVEKSLLSSRTNDDSKPNIGKRARFSASSSSSNNNNNIHFATNTTDNTIWVEKYTPTFSTDLCVAPKKVTEIRAWIQDCLDRKNKRDKSRKKKKLLVLVGSPGIGKSTCIRVLANEMKFDVQSWNESFQPRSHGTHPNNLLALEQSSALDSFEEFLQSSGTGFSSLDLCTTIESDESYVETGETLILLEDLPNLHGPEAEFKFRTILSRHLQCSLVPTVLIFSDVSEGKHNPEDLERIIDPNDLYDNDKTTILQIHAVTKPKMKKVLTTIGRQENFSLDANFVEELHSQSRGDLRHAIMTLQLHAVSGSRRTTTTGSSVASLRHGNSERDTKLSTFHSLGKLLYAKRTIEDGRDRLAFDPDTILERSDMGLEGSLRFLESHSLEFFSDITDISNAYKYFSDSVELLDNGTTRYGDTRERQHDLSVAFPYACAAAVAGRSVANTNLHPAPNKFRQFSRPKVFDVLQNRKQNQVLVEQLSRRLSNCRMSLSSGISDPDTLVTEILPFVRGIFPEEVDPVVHNLYSVAAERNKYRRDIKNDFATEKEEANLKQQAEILGTDDISEFGSDSE